MQRLRQFLLISTLLIASWLLMQAVHELGHVLGASCTGGIVTKVVLHPLAISRTDVEPNPNPIFVVWAGPILGILIPVACLLASRWLKNPFHYLLRFFAGFCLTANGLYIAIGSFDRIGDAGTMQATGSPIWLLWLFGLITTPVGFLLWHNQGSHFGFGEANGKVSASATLVMLVALLVVLSLELTLSARG